MMARILCVDDDINILAGFHRNLRKHFDITNALGGPAALKIIDEKEPFDVIVTDMRMPGMTGLEFLSLAYAKSPDSIQVMLTGAADMNTAMEAANSGRIFRFLVKPCAQEVLVATLKAAIDQHELRTHRTKLLDTAATAEALGELKTLSEKAQESEHISTLLRRNAPGESLALASLDKVTGLPAPAEAEVTIRAAAEAYGRAQVVVFALKLQHARARFGSAVADQIMHFAAQKLADELKAPWAAQGLCRWHGEAFAVIVPGEVDIDEIQGEAKNVASQPLSYHFETRTRDAFIPVKMAAAVLTNPSAEQLMARMTEFAQSQARDMATI
jgi:CheY-like chemotaxis protein